jgi:hypothetical protein
MTATYRAVALALVLLPSGRAAASCSNGGGTQGFCLIEPLGKITGVGTPRLPSEIPPFVHFDLREFQSPACTIPYSFYDGTPDIAGIAEFDAVDAAFATWAAVTPALFTFTRVLPGAGAKCPHELDGHNMIGWNDINCKGPGDDNCAFTGNCFCSGPVAANTAVIDGGVDGYITTTPNNCGQCFPPPGTCDDFFDPSTGKIMDGGNGKVDSFPSLSLPASTFAQTALFVDTTGGRLLEADILFNDQNYLWANTSHGACVYDADNAPTGNFPGAEDVDCNRNNMNDTNPDVRSVALHEIGHVLGLFHANPLAAGNDDIDRPPFGNFPGAEDVDNNGNNTLDTPSVVMRSTLFVNDQTLAPGDEDGVNFLYTPDLGDAPDPQYPSKVHGGAGRTLNGVALAAPGSGPEHLFGFLGTPAAPRYQYEWLGTSTGGIDDGAQECEARLPNLDAFDDGVSFAGPFVPGGAAVAVTINVRTAMDVENGQHTYDDAHRMYLNAWFDWNANGDWGDAGEHVIGATAGAVASAGANVFNVAAPAGAVAGGYARFRLDYYEDVGRQRKFDGIPADVPLYRWAMQFGEVEDHLLQVMVPPSKSKCSSKKATAAGKDAADEARCAGKGVSAGTSADQACLDKADGKLLTAWAKAETHGDCLAPTGDVVAMESDVDGFVADLLAALVPVSGSSRCTAAKLSVAGKKAAAWAKCEAKGLAKAVPPDPLCAQKAHDTFARKWATAESKGDCLAPAGDGPAIEADVETFVAELVAALTDSL